VEREPGAMQDGTIRATRPASKWMLVAFMAAACCALVVASGYVGADAGAGKRWPNALAYYGQFKARFADRFDVTSDRLLDDVPDRLASPNNVYWCAVLTPEPGQGTVAATRTVYVDTGRGHSLRVTFPNHDTEPTVKWINEKLLYLEVWRNEMIGSYLILDVEREETVARDTVQADSPAPEQVLGEHTEG